MSDQVNTSNYHCIETLTGTNYSKWKQDLAISLGLLDYDFVLKENPLQVPVADASAESKARYVKWEKTNKMTMLIMKRSMASSIKGSIPKIDNAKEYYENIAQRFKVPEKSTKSSLLNKLTDMNYDEQECVRAHIMNMIDNGAKLQELNMTVDKDMMVHFAFNSLPKEFKSLRNTYVVQKESWTLNDLITISVEIEDNLIRERGTNVVNMIQTRQYKGNKNTETGKQKEKDNSNALKPIGIKCFFCKKNGHMKKECRRYKKWLDKQKARGFIRKRLPSKDEVKVFVGNGDKVQVYFIGVVRIELDFGFILDLEDVVYVPSIGRT